MGRASTWRSTPEAARSLPWGPGQQAAEHSAYVLGSWRQRPLTFALTGNVKGSPSKQHYYYFYYFYLPASPLLGMKKGEYEKGHNSCGKKRLSKRRKKIVFWQWKALAIVWGWLQQVGEVGTPLWQREKVSYRACWWVAAQCSNVRPCP